MKSIARNLPGLGFVTCVALSFFANAVLAFTVESDRTSIPLNETFTVTLSSKERGLDKVDLGPISKNFDILSRSSQSEYSMVHGKTQSLQKIILTLSPRQKGVFTIPPLTHNRQNSNALSIEILDAVSPPAQLGDESIFLEASADKQSVFVGEQLVYTLTLYYRVNLSGAELSELEIEDADIYALEDRSFHREINGHTYQVVEKRYAVLFNGSGVRYINGQTLTGRLAQQSPTRFGFDPFVRGKVIRLAAEEISVRVKSPPADGNEWLAAELLKLEENWSKTDSITLGEPISRTITLFARGLAAESLPEIPLHAPDNVNSYPEKPELSNHQWHGGLAGSRRQTIVYIPTTTGTMKIPETSVRWWNTKTSEWSVATLPARTFSIEPAANGNQENQAGGQIIWPDDRPMFIDDQVNASEAVPAAGAISPAKQEQGGEIRLWQMLSLLFLVLWLLTLASMWLRNKSRSSPGSDNRERLRPSLENATKELLKACRLNNPAEVAGRLRNWRTETASLLKTRPDLRNDNELQTLLINIEQDSAQINKALYGGEAGTAWDSGSLQAHAELFSKTLHRKLSAAKPESRYNGALKPLYPESTQ